MYDNDTITAISTPFGEAGISIVRMSGNNALTIAEKIFLSSKGKNISEISSGTINHGKIIEPKTGQMVDEVLLTVMKAPFTYTREDIIEINCHGGISASKRILELTLENGARLAEPGEFTKRAFLNGRIDLSQAEAVMDLISAKTNTGLTIAANQLEGKLSKKIHLLREELLTVLAHIEAVIDFPEEDIDEITIEEIKGTIGKAIEDISKLLETSDTGKIIREGLKTVIIGKPNVGKSSLLNALLDEKRAIVTNIPGTTRDIIEEFINIKGIPLKIIDTAGIRETEDIIEKIGVEKTKEFLYMADLVLIMFDASDELTKEDEKIMGLIGDKKSIILINKTDLPQKLNENIVYEIAGVNPVLKISVLEDQGIEELKEQISDMFFSGKLKATDGIMITSIRHKELLRKALNSLKEANSAVKGGMPLDLITIDIKEAFYELGNIVGETVKDNIIDEIFSRFCVGK